MLSTDWIEKKTDANNIYFQAKDMICTTDVINRNVKQTFAKTLS